MTNYREILRLKSQGYSERNIALAVSCSRNTVSDVLKRAASHQISWPLKANTTNADLKKILYPQISDSHKRLPDLLIELSDARRNDSYDKVLKKYTKPALLIIDEWLLLPLNREQQPDIFEILTRRYHKRSTIFCSQYREEGWYQQLGGNDAPLTDGILDRIVHDAYRIEIEPIDPSKDISMREIYGLPR